MFVVSDRVTELRNCSFKLNVFLLKYNITSFEPLYSVRKNLAVVPALASTEVDGLSPTLGLPRDLKEDGLLFTATLEDAMANLITPKAVLFPQKLYGTFGTAELIRLERLSPTAYSLTIHASNVLPLIWLDLIDELKFQQRELLFYFSENGFAMTSPTEHIKLIIYSNPKNVDISAKDIYIRVL